MESPSKSLPRQSRPSRHRRGREHRSSRRRRRRRQESESSSTGSADETDWLSAGAMQMGLYGMAPPMWMGGKMPMLPQMPWQALGTGDPSSGSWMGGAASLRTWPAPCPGDARNGFSTTIRRHSRSRSRSRGRRRSRSRSGPEESEYFRIPRAIMGRVIGKQGATINDIREKTGARIDAEDCADGQCEFRIRGPKEAVEKAKTLLKEVADKACLVVGDGVLALKGDDSGEGGTTDTLEFPVSAAGAIIGTKGAKISDVRQQSGAQVQIEKSKGTCKVKIAGTLEQIEHAKGMIQKLVEEDRKAAEAENKEGDPDAISEYLNFPVTATGGIIGTRGAKIAEVRQTSGASVSVEKLEDKCQVTISGSAEQVKQAKTMIKALVEGVDSSGHPLRKAGDAEDVMEVPHNMLGRVIGKGGETIQRLQRESGARIDVTQNGSGPCPLRISGSRDAVTRARFMIAEVLDRGSLSDRRETLESGIAAGPPLGIWPPDVWAGGMGWNLAAPDQMRWSGGSWPCMPCPTPPGHQLAWPTGPAPGALDYALPPSGQTRSTEKVSKAKRHEIIDLDEL